MAESGAVESSGGQRKLRIHPVMAGIHRFGLYSAEIGGFYVRIYDLGQRVRNDGMQAEIGRICR